MFACSKRVEYLHETRVRPTGVVRKQLDLEEEAALKQAIAALEQVPDDAGFGLIGRI